MDLPHPEEDVLRQPTRAQIFNFLIERRAPAGTEEVADHFSLHPNGVRRHLERLEEGGFIVRSRVRQGQGRPRDSWMVSPDAHPGGQRPSAYGDLAAWLARAIPANANRLREVERVGREIGTEVAPEPSGDLAADLERALTALGFRPSLDEASSEEAFSCKLRNCPYRDSALANREVVCTLHRGITEGLLAALEPGARLSTFEPHDPDAGNCRVEVAIAGAGRG